MSQIAEPVVPRATQPVTRSHLTWLERELSRWQAEGLVAPEHATAIVARYRVEARLPIARVLLGLGGVFVGIGVIWLVAANIESLPPGVRFLLVSTFWIAFLLGAEALAANRDPDRHSPLVGALRLVAALAFGAVIFQAAQSLQVPAYEPALVGWWALGTFVHAYAVRAVLPLIVAIGSGAVWFGWQVLPDSTSGLTVVLLLLGVALLGVAMAGMHTRWAPNLGAPWRETGAAFLLAGLFAAALPFVDTGDFETSRALVVVLAVTAALAVAALVVGSTTSRWEVLGTAAALAAGTALVAWDAGDSTPVQGGQVVHALVSVGLYVVVAVGVAVLGALRESWRLTVLATIGLVVFTTFQSFAVFAEILQGAWLFVVLGLVFLGTGYGFDRGRRKLVAVVLDEDQRATTTGATS
jgi:uncharacterized membrane protein